MHELPAKHPLAFPFGPLITLILLLFAAPGCCNLFEPTDVSVNAWVHREIPVGTSRVDAVQVIESHGLKVFDSDAGKITANLITGKCIDNPVGYAVDVEIIFDSHQRAQETHVDKGVIICDCPGTPFWELLFSP